MSGLPAFGYYGQHYPSVESRRSLDGYAQAANMIMTGDGSTPHGMTNGGQSLDEIIHQNNLEMMRRRTYQQPHFRPPNPENHVRRSSMLEFGAPLNDDMANFQFDPNPAPSVLSTSIGDMTTPQKSMDPRKVRSRENLNVDTHFPPMDSTYNAYPNTSSYSPVLMSGVSMNMEPQYMPQSMDLSMDYDNASGDVTPINTHPTNNHQPLFTDSPLDQNFPLSYPDQIQDTEEVDARPNDQVQRGGVSHLNMQDSGQSGAVRQDVTAPDRVSSSRVQDTTGMSSPVQRHQQEKRRMSLPEQQSNDNVFNNNGEDLAKPRPSRFANKYSASGFDMLGVLIKVAQRPNPEINIGPVDLSCAFVVCDIAKHDMPIVYCSDVFERLTGYTRFEILGRNCRFLQAPDGKVQAGVKRKYVDDGEVLKIKNKLTKRAEVQLSIINYRKGGQPFMNLLTMIPVTWDSDEYKYYVGFQVDLVEQPNSVQAKNPNGSFLTNYQRGQFPHYVLQTPDTTLQADMGQTIGRDEVSTVLSTIGAGESDLSKRIWDKVLLENTDDVVHVLSLKGLFLYLSPASRKVLEYDASELVGTALSSVCHPSDIVPVTRELKDTSSGAAVNVVFRIRRKHSGYTWFESHGCLHTEQGKGRKCIILVGRQRPVYALARGEIAAEGGIGDSELWTKMSTSGMFLYVSSNARQFLDRCPEDLIGTSIQALMRPDSKRDFGRVLEVARTGQKATVKHDILTRRGQVLQAQTTIYPGDAEAGQKPTFIVGQTKFVKMTKALLMSQKPEAATSPRTDRASGGSGTPSSTVSGGAGKRALSRSSSANPSFRSVSQDSNAIVTNAGSDGLVIGNQDEALASEDNIFDELKTTRSTSWQFELRQMEKQNRLLIEELTVLNNRKKKRKRRKINGQMEKDCANCHTRVTPEWRRGPSGNRDLCNSCGLRWAKQVGRVSPRKYSDRSDKQSASASESTADHPKPAVPASLGRASGGGQLASLKPKRERAVSPRHRHMPAKIEEVQEPPHDTVLPA